MANGACRHLSCGRLKHLFHEHRAVRETSVLAIGGDGPGRCIDDMKLLRTLALVSCHRPASQRLIGGAIGIGYMQIPSHVDYGLRVRPAARRGRTHLPMRGDGEHCRYSCYADSYNLHGLHDPFLSSRRNDLSSRRDDLEFAGVTLCRAFLCPTRDRTGSKPDLSWRWPYGKTRIPPSLSLWQLELLAHDD